jgi:YegS/Rv2252/BmrU family lipid kinase
MYAPEETRQDWLVIVNPNAGHGEGGKDWSEIDRLLVKNEFDFLPQFTSMRRHAILLTQQGIQAGFRKFIVVGGDGTLNEVVNGVFKQDVCPTTDITLAMIKVGSGNDWARLFSIPGRYDHAIQVIRENKTRLHDVGVVHYYDGIERERRYFINTAGLGFDAAIVSRTNQQKEKGRTGRVIYLMNLLKSLALYRHTMTSVEIDEQKIKSDILSISIGIGRYTGNGMMQTPKAIPDDGLFDVTVIHKMSKSRVVASVRRLYDGTILDHPKIHGYKGKDILIDSNPIIHLETDGESLGHSPFEFNLIPQSVNVIYKKFPEFQG